jgi:8-oxo-dGTP diphosphatase
VTANEWWDVLDAQGHPTGRTYRRGAADWPPGRFHLVVATCVALADGRMLTTQRAAGKDFPLTWELPGGSALAGESSTDAALRELCEETGVSLAASDLRIVGRHVEATALMDLYVAVLATEPRLTLDRDEVAAAEWVSPERFTDLRDRGALAPPWYDRLETLWEELSEHLPPSRR